MGKVLTLLDATVDLFLEGADGTAQLDAKVFTGCCVEQLRVRDGVRSLEVWPTGAPYPVQHHVGEAHEIEILQTWMLDPETLRSYMPVMNQRYALVIRWEDEETGTWSARTYFGVTDVEAQSEHATNNEGLRPMATYRWVAEHAVQSSGVGPFDASAALRPDLYVRWRNGSENIRLYDYDQVSGEFSEHTPSAAAHRATVENEAFRVVFNGASEAAAECSTDTLTLGGVVEAAGIVELASPWLEFWINARRVATLNSAGVMRLTGLAEQVPMAGTGQFQLLGPGGELVATLGEGGLVAANVTEDGE